MLVLYPSDPASSQDRYENKNEEDGKGTQGQTDSHKETHCTIEPIEDWQPNRGEQRGHGHGYSELVRYIYHATSIVGVTRSSVNQSVEEPKTSQEPSGSVHDDSSGLSEDRLIP